MSVKWLKHVLFKSQWTNLHNFVKEIKHVSTEGDIVVNSVCSHWPKQRILVTYTVVMSVSMGLLTLCPHTLRPTLCSTFAPLCNASHTLCPHT